MKIFYGLILLSLTLAACGGGGSGGNPIPIQTNPPPQTSIAFSEASLTSSQSVARRIASVTLMASCQANPNPPVVLQALDGFTPQANWSVVTGAFVTATEYDASCKPLPAQAQYAIADATIASTSSSVSALPLPSPSPGTVAISGHKHGATSVVATFKDGTTATIAANVYDEMGVGCSNYYAGPITGIVLIGWSATSGSVQNAANACGRTFNPIAPSDVHVDGSTSALDFPGGYQVLTGDQSSLPGIANCASFASQGTQAGYGQSQVTAPKLPDAPFVLLFKTASGACVKVAVTYLVSINGAPTLAGLYAVSDSTGKFAY